MNTATQTAALAVRDLHAWYGESHVLQGVNFHVQHGEVVTLLGRNGAGRTTTLRAAASAGLAGAHQRGEAVRTGVYGIIIMCYSVNLLSQISIYI